MERRMGADQGAELFELYAGVEVELDAALETEAYAGEVPRTRQSTAADRPKSRRSRLLRSLCFVDRFFGCAIEIVRLVEPHFVGGDLFRGPIRKVDHAASQVRLLAGGEALIVRPAQPTSFPALSKKAT